MWTWKDYFSIWNNFQDFSGFFRDLGREYEIFTLLRRIEFLDQWTNCFVTLQHRCLRRRGRCNTGAILVETGTGADEMGRRIHQLVASNEDPPHHHRPLPRRLREQRALPPGQVLNHFQDFYGFQILPTRFQRFLRIFTGCFWIFLVLIDDYLMQRWGQFECQRLLLALREGRPESDPGG